MMNKQNWQSKGFKLWLTLLLLMAAPALAQDKQKAKEEQADYAEVVKERAEKIVMTLGITDPLHGIRVRNIIAQQYRDLRNIHDSRDAETDKIKKKAADNKETTAKRTAAIEKKADTRIARLHTKYIAKLSTELTPEQVDLVKDGMTYNAYPITYLNYLAMLPNLTETEKAQLKAWLIEAREQAMDGGSSKEKLAWFGKYKGKITNYLTAAGYDLKGSEAIWLDKIKKSEAAADKVMAVLNLENPAKAKQVREIIKQHYYTLAEIHGTRNKQVKEANKLAGTDKARADAGVTAAWTDAKEKLDQLQAQYLAQLTTELSPAQIVKVKDAMTDDGLAKDYNRFLAMLPNLTEGQKVKIMDYLLEARENAMSAANSKEIHQWFAKYRGRANNYLSAEGYDLRKATEYLKQKQEAESASTGI